MTGHSLNEVFSACRSAARGAGLPWGMADECGRAARVLSCRGLPLMPVVEALERRGDLCPPDPDSRPLNGIEAGKWLCPFATGALLSDEARRFARAGGCRLGNTAWPLLLLPFAARLGESVSLQWAGARVLLLRGEPLVDAAADRLTAASVEQVVIETGDPSMPDARPPDFPPPGRDFWERIGRLAARTYVPSGETSRRDAGAGLTDND